MITCKSIHIRNQKRIKSSKDKPISTFVSINPSASIASYTIILLVLFNKKLQNVLSATKILQVTTNSIYDIWEKAEKSLKNQQNNLRIAYIIAIIILFRALYIKDAAYLTESSPMDAKNRTHRGISLL